MPALWTNWITLTEVTGDYRQKPLLCPACSAPMGSQQSELAIVDLCPDCNGLWIDWFDGEIASVAAGVGGLPPAHVPTRAGGACPVCAVPLALAPYGDDAVDILRCGECAGAFVPRASYERLVLEGPPGDPEDESGVLVRFVAWLKAHLHRGS